MLKYYTVCNAFTFVHGIVMVLTCMPLKYAIVRFEF